MGTMVRIELTLKLEKKQPPGALHKKGALKHFEKFTGKHLC